MNLSHVLSSLGSLLIYFQYTSNWLPVHFRFTPGSLSVQFQFTSVSYWCTAGTRLNLGCAYWARHYEMHGNWCLMLLKSSFVHKEIAIAKMIKNKRFMIYVSLQEGQACPHNFLVISPLQTQAPSPWQLYIPYRENELWDSCSILEFVF